MPAAAHRKLILFGGVNNPKKIPGLGLWLEGPRITGLSDGAAVSPWSDLSGLGRNATQAIGTKQPIYRSTTTADIINGKPTVKFDVTDDSLDTIAGLLGISYTIIAVYKHVQNASNKTICSQNNGASGRAILGIAGTVIRAFEGDGAGNAVGTTNFTLNSAYILTWNRSGTGAGSMKGYVNGVLDLTATHTLTPPTAAVFSLGTNASGSAGEVLASPFGGLVVYPNRSLPSSEQKFVEKYVGNIFSITTT